MHAPSRAADSRYASRTVTTRSSSATCTYPLAHDRRCCSPPGGRADPRWLLAQPVRARSDGAARRRSAAHGYAAWNIGYPPRRDDGGGWPGTLTDVAAAVDLLATIAAAPTAGSTSTSTSTGRVAIVGHSAGGHLALWAAGRRRSRVAGRPVRIQRWSHWSRSARARWSVSQPPPRRGSAAAPCSSSSTARPPTVPTAMPWRPRRCQPARRWWPWSGARRRHRAAGVLGRRGATGHGRRGDDRRRRPLPPHRPEPGPRRAVLTAFPDTYRGGSEVDGSRAHWAAGDHLGDTVEAFSRTRSVGGSPHVTLVADVGRHRGDVTRLADDTGHAGRCRDPRRPIGSRSFSWTNHSHHGRCRGSRGG